jgi:hypothetical protein
MYTVYAGAKEIIPEDIPEPLSNEVVTTTLWTPTSTMICSQDALSQGFFTSSMALLSIRIPSVKAPWRQPLRGLNL